MPHALLAAGCQVSGAKMHSGEDRERGWEEGGWGAFGE